jgi:tRNA 5-methylaminomethyl-2-thiouridine biosynthesis bifunctional protein
VLARAPLIVLAAGPGLREGGIHGLRGLPALGSSLGQVSWFAADGPPPRMPVSGHGYALKLGDGQVLCGATTQPEGNPAGTQEAHLWNLQRLHRLTGLGPAGPVYGRQGMRIAPVDRLPLIGPLPLADPRAAVTQVRRVPRLPGVYVAGGFGSRGLIWAPLAGALIAAWVEDEPLPLPSDLLDAVDPARGLVRQARRANGTPPSPARGAMPQRASP